MATERGDGELVTEVLAGTQEAFGVLVARYKDAVFGVAFHRLGDFEEARDAAQETFVKAFRNLRKLRRPEAFANWLCRIAEGTATDAARRRRGEVSLEDVGEPAVPRVPHGDEVAEQVREALGTLPEATRLAVILHYVNGYSHAEVAEFLGTTEGAVKTRVSRGRARLREEMAEMVEQTLKEERPVVKARYEDPRTPNAGFIIIADDMTKDELQDGLLARGYRVKRVWIASRRELQADERKAKRWPQDLFRGEIHRAAEEGASAVRFALPSPGTWLLVQLMTAGKWRTVRRLSGSRGKGGFDWLEQRTGQHLLDGIRRYLAELCAVTPEEVRPRQTYTVRYRLRGKAIQLSIAFHLRSLRVDLAGR